MRIHTRAVSHLREIERLLVVYLILKYSKVTLPIFIPFWYFQVKNFISDYHIVSKFLADIVNVAYLCQKKKET